MEYSALICNTEQYGCALGGLRVLLFEVCTYGAVRICA